MILAVKTTTVRLGILTVTLLPAVARAESIAISAAFHFTPQAIDYASTRSCMRASSEAASCLEGNEHVSAGSLALKKVSVGAALTAGDYVIGKRTRVGVWIFRAGSVVGLGLLPLIHNRKNEARVRAAEASR